MSMFNFKGRASNNPQSFRDLQRFKNISFKQRHSVKPFEQKLFGPFNELNSERESNYVANRTFFPGKFLINTEYPYESNWFINDGYTSRSLNLSVDIPFPGDLKITRKDTFDGKFSLINTKVRDVNNINAEVSLFGHIERGRDTSLYAQPLTTFATERSVITSYSFEPFFSIDVQNDENMYSMDTNNWYVSRFSLNATNEFDTAFYGGLMGVQDSEFISHFRLNAGGNAIPGHFFGNSNPLVNPAKDLLEVPGINYHYYGYVKGGLTNNNVTSSFYLHYSDPILADYSNKNRSVTGDDFNIIGFNVDKFGSHSPYSPATLGQFWSDVNSDPNNENYIPSNVGQISAMFAGVNNKNYVSPNSINLNEFVANLYTFKEPITTTIPITLSSVRTDNYYGGEYVCCDTFTYNMSVAIPDNLTFQNSRNSIHTTYSFVSSLSNPLDSFSEFGRAGSYMTETSLSAAIYPGSLASTASITGAPYYNLRDQIKEKVLVFLSKPSHRNDAVYNTAWWGYSARDLFNISGVTAKADGAKWNDDNNCTLITPRHGVTARHWQGSTKGPEVGDIGYFYHHTTGAAITAMVEAVDRNPSDPEANNNYYDIEMLRFDRDIQAASGGGVKIYKVPLFENPVAEYSYPTFTQAFNSGIFGQQAQQNGNGPAGFLVGSSLKLSLCSGPDAIDSNGNYKCSSNALYASGNIRQNEPTPTMEQQIFDRGTYRKNFDSVVGYTPTSQYTNLQSVSSCFKGMKFGSLTRNQTTGDSGSPYFIPITTSDGPELLMMGFNTSPGTGPVFGRPEINNFLRRAIERTGNTENYHLTTVKMS